MTKICIEKRQNSRSTEANEVLGKSPHWLIRSGISVFFLFLLLMIGASWVIKYPDIVRVKVAIEEGPVGYSHVSGKMADKIRPDQEANIKLEAYPFDEYGVLKGYVMSVSGTPDHGKFTVKYGFPNGFKTTQGKSIDYIPGMTGTAQVFTEEIPLFDHIFKDKFTETR